MTVTMEQVAALCGLPVEPLARLIYLDAPEGETECEFWRRRALERAKENTALKEANREFRQRVAELEAKDV